MLKVTRCEGEGKSKAMVPNLLICTSAMIITFYRSEICPKGYVSKLASVMMKKRKVPGRPPSL